MKHGFITKSYLLIFFIVVQLFVSITFISAQDLFWENPEILIARNVWFPLTSSSSELSVVMWQEFEEKRSGSNTISISLIVMIDNNTWIRRERVLGPFPFIGDKVSISSLAVDNKGIIYIALSNSEDGILIYFSEYISHY